MEQKNQDGLTVPEAAQTQVSPNTTISETWNPENFEFQPIDELFDFPADYDDQVADEFKRTMQDIVPTVNLLIPSNVGIKNTPESSFDNFSKVFNNPNSYMQGVSNEPLYEQPLISGAKSSGFDRVKDHYKFDELGYNPLRDNEKYYNQNSSATAEFFTRQVPYWSDGLGSGFMSGYRAIGDLFDDDSYWMDADYQSSYEFAEANRMGSSTRGGFGGGASNLFLQTGYTFGIIGSIAAEELALAAGSAAISTTGVGAPAGIGAFLVGTGRNFVRGIKTMGNLFDVTKAFKAGGSILDSIRTVKSARDAFTSIRAVGAIPFRLAGTVFAPETMAAIKAMKSAENTANGITSVAKMSKGFGAFYRDMRSINFAMSEGKMEAGFAFNEIYAEGVRIKSEENGGGDLTREQLEEINTDALKGATETLWLNAPAIFLTNKLVLGTALKGFSPTLRRIFSDKLPGFAKNIVRTKGVRTKGGGLSKGLYTDVTPKTLMGNFLNIKRLKALGARTTLKNTGAGLLRYSAASIGEGLQEVYQEGVQVGVVDYHRTLMENPLALKTDAKMAAMKAGFNSQMSAEGAHVFMSGFLMGGIVQGPQRAMFEVLPEIYQKKKNPEQYKKYQENKEKYIKIINEIGDDIQDNPFDYFNPTNLSLFQAQEGDEETKRSLLEDDHLGFQDAKDIAAFQHRHFLMTAGATGLYVEQLEDLLGLKDEELKELYPDSAKDVSDVREKIQKSIDGMKVQEKEYNDSFDVIRNPENYEQYDKDTKEYNDSRIKHNAIEHARLLYLVAKNEFKMANGRRFGLEAALESSDVLSNLQAGDLTKLLTSDTIDQEVVMLMKEIKTLQDTDNKDKLTTKDLKQKQKLLTSLLTYKVALDSIYDKDSKVYDRSKSNKLRTPLINYLKVLGARSNNKNGYIKRGEVDKVLAQLLDHNNLDTRSQLFDRTVALFGDPEKVLDLVDRLSDQFKVLYSKAKDIFEKNMEAGVADEHANILLQQLKELGIVISDEQFKAFIETRDVASITQFISAKGVLNPEIDKEIFEKINALISIYKETSGFKVKEEEAKTDKPKKKATEAPKSKDNFDDAVETNLDESDFKDINSAPDANILLEGQSPVSQDVLEQMYASYKIKNINEGNSIVSLEEWLNSTEGNNAVNGLDSLKRLWFKTLDEQGESYNAEEGFKAWVAESIESKPVKFLLALGGIDSSIFTAESEQGLESIVNTNTTKVAQLGPGVNIVKRTVYQEGSNEPDFIYSIVDNKGKTLPQTFLDEANARNSYGASQDEMDKAWSAWERLLKIVPSEQAYNFDGQEIKYGDEVVDVDGNKYIVLGTESSTKKGNLLKLIPFEKLDASKNDKLESIFYVEEAGFNTLYTKEQLKVAEVKYSANMTKIDHRDINGIYAKQMNNETTGLRETVAEAEARLQKILERLTEQELNESIVRVVLNIPKDGTSYQLGVEPENPFISKNGDKYMVQISLSQEAAEKVSDLYPAGWDGSIAFVRNNHFSFKGKNGKSISINEFTDNNLNAYILAEGSSIEDLKSQVIKQAALTGKLDAMENNASMTLAEFQEQTNTELKLTQGKFSFDGIAKSLDDLVYGTFDGNTIIITNTKNKDGSISTNYTTDIKNVSEEVEFIQSVKDQLDKSELESGESNLSYVASITGRYVAVVKSPSGAITLVQLKQKAVSESERTVLYSKLVQRAKDTVNDNIKDGKVVDSKYNYDFNDSFNSGFYLASVPNSFVDLKVQDNGDILLKLSVKDKKGQGAKTVLVAFASVKARNIDALVDNPMLVEELFAKINVNPKVVVYNKTVPNKVNLSGDSMTVVFDTKATAQEMIEKTVTDIDPRVRHSQKMYFNFTGNLTEVEEIIPGPKEKPVSEFDEFVETGKGSEATLQNLATKIQNAGPLTPQEAAIFQANTALINQILVDRKAQEDAGPINEEVNPNQKYEDALADVEQQIKDLRSEDGSILPKDMKKFKALQAELVIAKQAADRGDNKGFLSIRVEGDVLVGQEAVEAENSIESYIAIIEKSVASGKITKEVGKDMIIKYLGSDSRYKFYMNELDLIDRYVRDRLDSSIPKVGNNKAKFQVWRQGSKIKAKTQKNESEQTLEEQITTLEKQKKVLESEINTRAKAEGLNRYNLKQESEEYKNITSKIKELKAQRKNAFKIVDTQESISEDLKIDEFISWAQNNLPGFITVKDINEVKDRLKANGFTAGKFVMSLRNLSGGLQGEGTIYTSPSTLIAYHEAFHAVFRMLLTDKEQSNLLRIAKGELLSKLGSQEALDEALGKFKGLNPLYGDMNAKRLEREYLEEYMADEFAKFKQNPRSTKTSSTIKSFFNRIVEWIKRSLKRFKGKSDLLNVFENIDSGKYRGSSIQENFYTRDVEGDVTIEALKAIPYESISGEVFASELYLDPATADILIRTIANTYAERIDERNEKVNAQKVQALANKFSGKETEQEEINKIYIGSVLADYADLYNPGNAQYSGENLSDSQADKLEQIYQALELNDGEAIIKEVEDYLELFQIKTEREEEEIDELEQSVGSRSTSQYGMESQEVGIKPSQRVKLFISSTTIDSTDMFGNTELLNGEKIKVHANYVDAHTGLMLAAMNQTSHFEILKRMYYHSRRSVNTSAVIDRFLNTVGITDSNTTMEDVIESGALPTEVKDSKLYHDFIKTYQNSRFGYNFHLKDPVTGKALIISATQSDAANAQIDAWKKFHGDKFENYKSNPETLTKALQVMRTLQGVLGKSNMTNKDIRLQAEYLSQAIYEAIGVSFSRGYLEVSIISALKNKSTNFQREMALIGSDSNLITKEDAEQFVNRLDVTQVIKGTKKRQPAPENLFVDDAGKGMSTRLNKLALGNANFDEAIGATVFVDVNGKLIYAHQKQTFHSNRIKQLNDVDFLQTLEETTPFLSNNILLNNPAFIQMAADNELVIERNSGTRITDLTEDKIDNLSEAAMTDEASAYGEMTSKEFVTMLIDMYTASYNTTSETNSKITYIEDGLEVTKAIAPVLLRIMEASNTNDMVKLPIIQTVNDKSGEGIGKYSILPNTVNLTINEIEREYNAIKENFKEGIEGPQGILGYNDVESTRPDKGRGFKFFKTAWLMDKATQDTLIEKAKKGEAFDSSGFDKGGSIIKGLESLVDEFASLAKDENIARQLSADESNTQFQGISLLARGFFPKSKKALRAKQELGLDNSTQIVNIAQIVLSNYLNTMAINQLILGEEARLFKDAFVDPIKRAKMQNRAITPVETTVVDPAKGIYHTLGEGSISMILVEDDLFEQRFTDGAQPGNRGGEKTDAQTYYTAKGARYFAFGLAELNDAYVELMDKVDEGVEITSEEWFGKNGYLKQNAVLNSKKYVYGDGNVFDKMSTTPLTKQETSDVVNGKRVAKQGMEQLNAAREMLEEFERNNPEKIAFLVPVSASKMFKQKVQTLARLSETNNPLTLDDITPLNAKDFGLQQVNPSNKTKVTLPNQIKTIVTSEQSDDEIVLLNGKEVPVGYIRKEYHRLTGAGIKFEFSQKKDLMFETIQNLDNDIIDTMVENGEVAPSYATFLRTAQANLKSSAAGSNQIEFFTDENGTNKYELNQPLAIKKFEQFFLSYFSQGVLQEKVEGHALALKSSFGKSVIRKVYSLDAEGNLDKQEVVRRKAYVKSGNAKITIDLREPNGFELLAEALKTNPEGVTVIDRLRVDLVEYVTEGDPSTWVATNERYAEGIVPAHYKEVMDLIENGTGRMPAAVAKMFAVRIPSQDKHSSLNVRIVDFDPVYLGSTGVFPEELVEVSGADFDIDKVFTHVKEWYVKNKQFIEYGRANVSEEESFSDYIVYQNKLTGKKGSYLYDALYKFETTRPSLSRVLDPEVKEELIKEFGFTADTLDALTTLNLPRTFAEYKQYKKDYKTEPYKGAINNQLLDLKTALQGNKGMTESVNGQKPVAYQPADVVALKAEVDNLFKQFPQLAELSKEDLPIDSLPGQFYTHVNVKQNSNLIGAVVPRNVVINFLKETEVILNPKWGSLDINGINYDRFETNVKNEETRAQYLLSALITAATDDAKERILSKLGFNKASIGVVETMIGLGVSLHTATMFVNVAAIRQAMKDPMTAKGEIKGALKELQVKEGTQVKVTDVTLAAGVNANATDEELYSIYETILDFMDVKKFIDNMIPIFNLNTGFGQDFISLNEKDDAIKTLGLYLDDKEFKKIIRPFDMRSAIKEHYVGDLLEVYNEFNTEVLPKVFLSRTEDFKKIYAGVEGYTKKSASAQVMDGISKNLLTYLTMKSYMHRVFNSDEAAAAIGGSLSNEFIYGNAETKFNANTIFEELREKHEGTSNYFLDYYLFSNPADSKTNTTGLNLIQSRSFGKLSANEKLRIQNGFHQLYGQSDTRADAVNIIHYAMVKDGLQYANGSIIDSLVPFIMENYLDSATDAVQAFQGKKSYESVFGVSLQELQDEFVNNYGESAINSRNIAVFSKDFISGPKAPHSYEETIFEDNLTYTRTSDEKPQYPFSLFISKTDINADQTRTTSYYKLVRANDFKKSGKGLGVTLMPSALNGSVKADSVVYEKIELKGAYKQNAIGFMFNTENFNRPTLAELREFSKDDYYGVNFDDIEGLDEIDNVDFDNVDFSGAEKTNNKMSNFVNTNRIATEDNIDIDGVNIAEATARPEEVNDPTDKLLSFISNKGLSKGIELTEKDQEKIDTIMSQIEDVDVDDPGTQLELDLGMTDGDSEIIQFFYDYINKNKENKEILKAAGIGTTQDGFIKSFKLSNFETIKEFLVDQGCRIKL